MTPAPGLFRRLLRFLLERLLRLYYTARDPATPRRASLALLFAVIYLVVPLDLVPDLLPLLGLADDATGLIAAGWWVSRHTSPQHRAQARATANRLLRIVELPT